MRRLPDFSREREDDDDGFSEFITVRSNIFMINDGKYASKMFLFAFIDIIC